LKVRKLEKLLNDNRRHHNSGVVQSTKGDEIGFGNDTTRNIGIYTDSQSSSRKRNEANSNTPQVSSRVSVLRANGRRAGLTAKFKKTRDSVYNSQVNPAKKGAAISNRSALQPLNSNRMGYTQG